VTVQKIGYSSRTCILTTQLGLLTLKLPSYVFNTVQTRKKFILSHLLNKVAENAAINYQKRKVNF